MGLDGELNTSTAPRSASTSLDEYRFADNQPRRAAPQKHLPEELQKNAPLAGCFQAQAYEKLIDSVAENIFDPTRLGNIQTLRNKYKCEIKDTKEAIERAHEALRIANDPYTDVLSAKDYAELRSEMAGSYGGIGIAATPLRGEYAPDKAVGGVVVQDVVPGGPAARAGLRAGDVIKTVDNTDVRVLTLKSAMNVLRGSTDSTAKIVFERDGKQMTADVRREEVNIPAVTNKAIEGGFAYIKLLDLLQADAADEMESALKKHSNAKGYILDLRDNRGGLMDNAYQIASLFMGSGEVVSVKSRIGSDPEHPQYRDSTYYLSPVGFGIEYSKSTTDWLPRISLFARKHDYVDKPVVILTNRGTASAAEILAGALKDQGEATVVGTDTFGKGIGQVIIDDMPGGTAIKVTNLRYYTPSGDWIGDGYEYRKGINPHIKVENSSEAEYGSANDAQYKAAIEVLKKKTNGQR